MKRKRIMTIGLISLITICVSLVTVEASTWTSTGRINNLPTYGKVKDLNIYNKKTTSTQIASFQTTEVSASLPTFGRLRNSNGALRSEWVYLIKGPAIYHGKEADAKKGYKYYVSVKTSDFEFGSENYVSFKFSADEK